MGWLFDAADVSILTLLLAPSVGDLLGATDPRQIAPIGGVVVGVKLVAWGLGGIGFGVVADRVGRSRTMVVTILIYSVFTGLSALAQTWQQLAILQAIAGSASAANGRPARRWSPKPGPNACGPKRCRSCRWPSRSASSLPPF